MVLKVIEQAINMLIEFLFLLMYLFKILAPLPFYQKIAVGAMSGRELTKC